MTHEYDITDQSDLDMLDEVDGEYYNWDQNHSGYLWLTDECVDKYGLERGIDVEPIDWNIWNDDDDLEMRDKGFKWDFHIQQYASVHTKDGSISVIALMKTGKYAKQMVLKRKCYQIQGVKSWDGVTVDELV